MACIPLLRILPCLVLLSFWLTAALWADDIRLYGELNYSGTEVKSTNRQTGEKSKTDSERYKQNYRLDLSKSLFPNLTLDGGAQVETARQFNDLDGDESDTKTTTVAPYIDAELRTPLYALSAGYRERYEKGQGSDIDTQRNYSDTYTLRAEWRPVELPRFFLSYLNTERHDEPFTRRNENTILQLNSRYEYKDYAFQYNYLRTEDDIKNVGEESQGSVFNSHLGAIRFSRGYLGGKVTVNANLRAEYTDQTFSGGGARDFAVFPAGNTFYTPDPNLDPSMNDVDSYIGFNNAQLDLGGSDVINIGLDFGERVEVDMLQLALDGELEVNSNIADPLNWAVYVSNDQQFWSSRGITSVEYLREEGHLEIRFSPAADNEYVMLVYNPPINPNQGQAVALLSLRGFVTRALDDGSELTTHSHNGQLSVGWKVTEKTRLLYDMNFQERKSSLFDDQRVNLTNGVTVLHEINEVFGTSGRVAVNEVWNQGKLDTTNYTYSAKLNARYLETLNQALIFSGSLNQDADEGDSTSNSLLLHTNAKLYEGWDVSFDQGYTWESQDVGNDSSKFFVRIRNSLVPHRRFNLIADYSITWEKEDGSDRYRSESGQLRALWIPTDTLSLSGEVQLRVTEESTDVFWEYGISWLPFRDGTLQCSLSYSAKEDAAGNQTRSFSPDISWDITEYANLNVRYSQGSDETNTEVNKFKTILASLKLYYD